MNNEIHDEKVVMSVRLKPSLIAFIYKQDRIAKELGSKPSIARALEQIALILGYSHRPKKVVKKAVKKKANKK